jgi:hypothetical protein
MRAAVILWLAVWAARGAPAVEPIGRFVSRYCIDCHSGDSAEAGLDLEALPPNLVDAAVFRTTVRIHDRIARGEMPPVDAQQPTAAEVAEVTRFLDGRLFDADAARVTSTGRSRLRRMTRSEYENTLRDVLALQGLNVRELLPPDGTVAGFDKIADGLDLSPAHVAAYVDAAEQALDEAIATRSTPPPTFSRRLYPAGLFKFQANLANGNYVLLDGRQHDKTLALRGGFEDVRGFIGDHDVADGDLPARRKLVALPAIVTSTNAVGLLVRNYAGYEAALNVAPIHAGPHRLRLSIWGFHWNQGMVERCKTPQAAVLRAHAEGHQQDGGRLLGSFTAPPLESRVHEIKTWLGPRESIVFDPASINWEGLQVRQLGGRDKLHVGPGVALEWFEIEGPVYESWPPRSHAVLFGDLPIGSWTGRDGTVPPRREQVRSVPGFVPAMQDHLPQQERRPPLETVQSATPPRDARRLLAAFLPRAFRRPVGMREADPYVALALRRLRSGDCFEDAMRRAYVAVLSSPEFLFHGADPVFEERIDLYRLASRLSYWLWNSPPDDALLAAARDGSLADSAVVRREVDRLLSDRRSRRFIEDFTDQWLDLRRVSETTPDGMLYPEYSFLLHEGMVAETRAFVREMIAHDMPVKTLVDSDFTMVTQRLAEHYGIPGVEGVGVRRVSLPPGSHRGGLLTQASILKLTANGTTTSPMKRGVWVMDRLLNEPVPPPPPGIAGVDPDTRGATSIREQLARHRSDSSCAACHAAIDPPGFALECFDPVGGYRDRYRSTGAGDPAPDAGHAAWHARYRLGPPVDASGTLADGRTFAGIEEFKGLLAGNPERLALAFTAHMIRYATGADISYADRRTVKRIVDSAEASGYGVRTLILAIATSKELFRR